MNNITQMFPLTEQTMSSLQIAELTSKRHDNVVRDLKALEEDGSISLLKFEERETYNNNNERTVYHLPFTETVLLVTGYSSPLRKMVIDEWEALRKQRGSLPSPLDQLKCMVATLEQHEQEQEKLKARVYNIEERVARLSGDTGYRTVLAHSTVLRKNVPVQQANLAGRRAASVCRNKGLKIGRVPDERFGDVGSYPIEVLNEVFVELGII